MTLREEFGNEVKNNFGGVELLFELSSNKYISWLELKINNDSTSSLVTTPPFGESFIACHPEDGGVEHFKTIEDAEGYIMGVEGNGSEGFSQAVMGGECWIAKKVKVSHFKETSNSSSDEYCQCGKNEDDEYECPSCKREKWPYEFDSMGLIEFHNVE